MFVRDWLHFTRDYSSTEKLRAYRITTVVYGAASGLVAWIVSTIPHFSVLALLLFGFAMVVPPAIAVAYLFYWRRTTEPAAYWGMVLGYAGGLVWFATIKWAASMKLALPDGASAPRRLFHALFVENGGVDPSYATTIVPLLAIPLLSFLTRPHDDGQDRFHAVIRGRQDAGDLVIKA
jgi:Na+/proline symporter